MRRLLDELTSDADGRFAMNIKAPGSIVLKARSPDGRSGTSAATELHPDFDAAVPDIVLRYAGSGWIRGVVVDNEYDRLSQDRASLIPEEALGLSYTPLDPRLDHLSSSSFRV